MTAWSSSATGVATISATGLATGVAAGTATIQGSVSGVSGTATLTVTVAAKTVTALAISPQSASVQAGASQSFTAKATYSDGTTQDVTSEATWTTANDTVAKVVSPGSVNGEQSGSTTVNASFDGKSAQASITVTPAAAAAVSVTTWHFDRNRTGLNSHEAVLAPSNVNAQSFGKLFSYAVDGYVYGEPLIAAGVQIGGKAHNVVYAATEADSVYAFDADTYGSGAPLWKVSLLKPGETPLTKGPIQPFEGVTSTPVIDPASSTIYVVSQQTSGGAGTFRLHALDLATGAEKFGGPVNVEASVPGSGPNAVNGVITLTSACIQRAALLLANNTIYMGFGSCPTGWLLAYDAQSLQQVGVFNSSPNLAGEGKYASAGGVWMGGGGPAADDAGNIYIVTGNGPWDGKTAWSDSVLKFNAKLQLLDSFTPSDYAYLNCADADLASGGLMVIPGTSRAVAGGKQGKVYLLNSEALGGEQASDAGALQVLDFDQGLATPYSDTCTDASGSHTATINSYEIFGTAAYLNGAVYLGVTPTGNAPAGIRQFSYSGTLTPGAMSQPSVQHGTRGTTPFISANGADAGIVWMIDTGAPIQNSGGAAPTPATLRAFDATRFPTELYNSSQNSADVPGLGIKFSSPVVANGKVYISTGLDAPTATNPQGEIDVYGLR